MKPPLKGKSEDDFQTPIEALYPLIPYLKKDWTIWECACGRGNLVKGLEHEGFTVIGTDILMGQDFLVYKPKEFDCIITNPPFSLKQKFLTRCYNLKKPFALLLPLTTFETRKRQKLFKKYGVQLILFDKRIHFEMPDGRKGDASKSWFSTAWFTWGLELPEVLNFVGLKPPGVRFEITEYGDK